MGIKNVSREGFGNQSKARQGLMGTIWCTVGEYERKVSANGKDYISGRCVVVGAGESFTFFSFWPSEKNSLDDFEERYPVDGGAYWLVTVSQNTKEGIKDDKKVVNTFTSLNIVGFKDDFDEQRDGLLTGTLLLDVENSKYREQNGEKKAWLLLKAIANNSYENKEGITVEKKLDFEIQGFDKVADAGYKLLAGDDVVDGSAVFVRARVSGSRLLLANVTLSNAPPAADTPKPAAKNDLDSFGGGGKKSKSATPKNPWD